MLHSEALSFKGPTILLLVRIWPSHDSNETLTRNCQCLGQKGRCSSTACVIWQWFRSFAEVCSLETKRDPWNHSTMDHLPTLLFPTQSTRNWELTLHVIMLEKTHTGYQIIQTHWLSDLWICSLNSEPRQIITNTLRTIRDITNTLRTYWVNRDLRDGLLQSFFVPCELAVRSLSFCQIWMELISILWSYWWEWKTMLAG